MAKLNDKQRRFAAEYLVDLNATQAAIRAGYAPNSAGVQAHDLLKNPNITALIAEGKQAQAARLEISADDVLSSIIRIRAAAEGEGKHNDALRANELLGKHLRLFTERQEISGPNGAPLSVVVVPAKEID